MQLSGSYPLVSFVVPINKELHTNVVSFHTFYAKFALKQILSFLETATA
jgi:hypothetical protein